MDEARYNSMQVPSHYPAVKIVKIRLLKNNSIGTHKIKISSIENQTRN